MKLIEKKCPNCGASLEFSETDKSCKCSYCHRAFEIERDTQLNVSELADQFNLNELGKPFKFFQISIFGVAILIFIAVFAFFISFSTSFHFNNITSTSDVDVLIDDEEKEDTKNLLVESVSDLTNDDLEAIDRNSSSIIYQSPVGRSDTTYSYQKTGDPRLEKLYVAYKGDSNYIVSIYKVVYHNFFNQADQQTVYVPALFENVKKNVTFSLSNGKNPAPEYYFNSEKSTYIYAYGSLEEAYNQILKPLETDYTISEK